MKATDQIFLSIITISKNAEKTIRKTLQSIANQNNQDFEHIIIDAESTDSTINIINDYSDHISNFISEPDNGIADAMNKGWLRASGDFIIFIHADDILHSNTTIDEIKETITNDNNHDLYAFSILYGTQDNHQLKKSIGMTPLINFKTGFWHQGVVHRRTVINAVGSYDTKYKIAVDYDWFLRAYRHGLTCKKSNKIICIMNNDGISGDRSPAGIKSRLLEEKNIHKNNCKNNTIKTIYAIWWLLYPIYRRATSSLRRRLDDSS